MRAYEPTRETTYAREIEQCPAMRDHQHVETIPLTDASRLTCECGAWVIFDHIEGEVMHLHNFVRDDRLVWAVELDEPPCAHWAPVEVP